ncbi:type II toxin-antitoxin system HicA family toxin [Halorubrum cibi]|uniref:Predicted RNA binding protein YcfA, dsRBD-like fold, HicA-like mRNA interferase family n=1 Tax=Halorubrum cibi TaxID=413815 RepID=A0A521E834_9EURY|nr:type II toxin-antitoxin system HicA family toxin [Halorubrum cibi]SMO79932.1 Predicted RNA binding protein YcfA, dsRBD-like fold, HicA-like mRNA interferase family [Halorubrum cibi]
MSGPPRNFSGREIVNVLTSVNYRKDRQRGSHAILKYTNSDTGEVRTVTVPLHDRVKIGTLQSIAEQCGAEDFDAWCYWIDEHR